MAPQSHQSSLVLVGWGIKFLSHLTTEAKAYIEKADKVLYLVNDPVAKDWIKSNHHNTESLDALYQSRPLRGECYQAIADHILAAVYQYPHVCVVLYGHPTVFAEPGLIAAEQAKKDGIDVRVLPGISAEDCLFADLLVNPASSGCQSFEASDFIVYERPFSSASHLILWQVGFIGALGQVHLHDNQVGIRLLTDYLITKYLPAHEVILYEAAQYPHFQPRIERLLLNDLPHAKTTPITTLYVPPASHLKRNKAVMQALGISL